MAWAISNNMTVSTANSTTSTFTTFTASGNTPLLGGYLMPFQSTETMAPLVWKPRGLELRPCHPDLPWQTCLEPRAHPPHRGADGDWNCRGRLVESGSWVPPASTQSGWRSAEEALRDMRGPQPGDFVLCSCGCACECDGQTHFNDSVCPCYYLRCSCVLDEPDEPRIVA
jgi:hypothetical protein